MSLSPYHHCILSLLSSNLIPLCLPLQSQSPPPYPLQSCCLPVSCWQGQPSLEVWAGYNITYRQLTLPVIGWCCGVWGWEERMTMMRVEWSIQMMRNDKFCIYLFVFVSSSVRTYFTGVLILWQWESTVGVWGGERVWQWLDFWFMINYTEIMTILDLPFHFCGWHPWPEIL